MEISSIKLLLAVVMTTTASLPAVVSAEDPLASGGGGSGSSRGRGGGVRVIGAGLGRTGTESLREALTELGYKTYHSESARSVRGAAMCVCQQNWQSQHLPALRWPAATLRIAARD